MRLTRRDWMKAAVAAPAFLSTAQAAQTAALKIKRVDPYVLKFGGRGGYVCCRIETERSVHGWGEGTTPPNVTRWWRRWVTGETDSRRARVGCGTALARMYIEEENFARRHAVRRDQRDRYCAVGYRRQQLVCRPISSWRQSASEAADHTSYRWGNIPRTAAAYAEAHQGVDGAGVRRPEGIRLASTGAGPANCRRRR